MTSTARDRIRAKQDKLVNLAEAAGESLDLQISALHPGSPKLRDLLPCIHPQWEAAIDHAIRPLESNRGLRT